MNTCNRTTGILTGIAASLCFASTASLADSTAAMDACVKAFVSTSVLKDRAVVAVATEAAPASSLTQRRSYAIVLLATGKQSGKRFAQATCRVDRNGTAIALDGKPLPTPVAEAKVALGNR